VLKIQTKLSSVFRHQKFLPVLTPSLSYEERGVIFEMRRMNGIRFLRVSCFQKKLFTEFLNGAQDWRAKISKLFIPKIKGLTSNFKELHQFSSFPVVVCFHLFLALFR
jgi:hypothetical protein